MKRILITGATGFIGRALAVGAVERGSSVWGVRSRSEVGSVPAGLKGVTSLRLPDAQLKQVVKEFEPEVIFHCAGSARPAQSFPDPSHDFRCSVPVLQDILEVVRTVAPQAHLVVLSSAAVYGQPTTLPILEKAVPVPISPYGFHKWLGEILSQEYAEIYGLRVSSARIFSAYGPNLTKQVVWDAINKLADREVARFAGTGEETRDFIYVDDLVEALFCVAAGHGEGHNVVNVASGVETKISDVVDTVARHMEVSNTRWKFIGKKVPSAPIHWRADISKLEALGFAPGTLFDEGVKQTLAWFQNQ